MINKLATEIHENNKKKGFHQSESNVGELLCLIHSEVSEALEAYRTRNHSTRSPSIQILESDNVNFCEMFECYIKNTFEDEMADIIIRVLDLCALRDIDIEGHIMAKIRYNENREYKHGNKKF